MREFNDLSFGVAVNQKISLGVEQDAASDFFRPVVEVCDPAQAGLDASDDDGYILERLTQALGVNDDGTIRALATFATRV